MVPAHVDDTAGEGPGTMSMLLRSLIALSLVLPALASAEPLGIWISPSEIAQLPMKGEAWDAVLSASRESTSSPQISDQNDPTNVRVMAKALVYVRTGDERLREEVIAACRAAIGTERGGRTLALGRELAAYIIAADLVELPSADDTAFRSWLRTLPDLELENKTLVSTHEVRPNNWGTHAGASRLALAVYLGDGDELARAAKVFRGWLGDRDGYAGFKYGDTSWQADASRPIGINPVGASRDGHSLDGVLPDDQRRGGSYEWPAPRENYVWEALQGALAQAVILDRAGYQDVWSWQDQALLRAVRWLNEVNDYPAEGDDSWQPHVVNYFYQTDFPAPVPSRPGKNVGFTDWTHGAGRAPAARLATPFLFR